MENTGVFCFHVGKKILLIVAQSTSRAVNNSSIFISFHLSICVYFKRKPARAIDVLILLAPQFNNFYC